MWPVFLLYGPLRWTAHRLSSMICVIENNTAVQVVPSRNPFLAIWPKPLLELYESGMNYVCQLTFVLVGSQARICRYIDVIFCRKICKRATIKPLKKKKELDRATFSQYETHDRSITSILHTAPENQNCPTLWQKRLA